MNDNETPTGEDVVTDDEPRTAGTEADYEVGYGKPPVHTRFQPGRSGNPRGRPKGTRNLRTDLIEELAEQILVREGDQARPIRKQRAVVKALVNGALKGDARMAGRLLDLIMRLTDTGEDTPEGTEPLHADEHEILQAFTQRIQRDAVEKNAPARSNHPPRNDDP